MLIFLIEKNFEILTVKSVKFKWKIKGKNMFVNSTLKIWEWQTLLFFCLKMKVMYNTPGVLDYIYVSILSEYVDVSE